MKNILFAFFAFSLASLLVSCGNAGYERNADGLIYRVYHTGKGDLIKPKTYLKIHQEATMGDSVFFTSFGKVPAYGFFDSLSAPAHDFLDILDEMAVGDSAIVIRSIDTLAKRGQLQINEVFKKGGVIKVVVKVLGSMKTEQELENDRVMEIEKYKKSEVAALEKYINGQNLKNVVKSPEGVFVAIEKEGAGQAVDSGMNVKVNYTGRLMNGAVFDSNLDTTFGHKEPFAFTVGARQVIPGWDIGVMKLKTGAKAKIFVPSMLGYGIQGSGPKLPPYSNLVFDIEILEARFQDSLSNK